MNLKKKKKKTKIRMMNENKKNSFDTKEKLKPFSRSRRLIDVTS
jgi:hypothetical protein